MINREKDGILATTEPRVKLERLYGKRNPKKGQKRPSIGAKSRLKKKSRP